MTLRLPVLDLERTADASIDCVNKTERIGGTGVLRVGEIWQKDRERRKGKM
jgi:hypothetical protein